MKTLSIIAFFLFISVKAQSPVNGVISYQDIFKGAAGSVNSNYDLYFNSIQSIYIMIDDSSQVKKNNSSNTLLKSIPQQQSDLPFYYKKLNNNFVIYNPKTVLKQYVVKDDSLNMNWEIHNEKRTIGNYVCSKATTEFRGRNYTAWFTSKIPVDYGPRKFSGLPGLILEIYDDKGVYKAYATEIKINNHTQNIEDVLKRVNLSSPISHTEFLDKRCGDALQFKKLIESRMGRGTGRLQLTSVGGSDNLEINVDDCKE